MPSNPPLEPRDLELIDAVTTYWRTVNPSGAHRSEDAPLVITLSNDPCGYQALLVCLPLYGLNRHGEAMDVLDQVVRTLVADLTVEGNIAFVERGGDAR